MANPKSELAPSRSGVQARQPIAGERATRRRGHPDDAPWTASRCLRTLRRLESRLALLRKLVDTPIDVHVHVQRARSTTNTEPTAKRSNPYNNDGEQTERPKRPRHTYGGRSKKRKSSTEPLLRASPTRQMRPLRAMKPKSSSMRTDQEALAPSPYATKLVAAQDTAGLATLYHVHESVEKDKDRICSEIRGWLLNLLWHTLTTAGEPHKKSLLGMCLRKIPACIDEIDAWDKAMAQDEAPNSIRQTPDAALDIYRQLEAFGAAGLGWRPLKQTLRAHGLWMLKKAIEEGVIASHQAAILVECCHKDGFVVEAAQLVLKPNGQYPSPGSESSSMAGEPKMEPLRSLLFCFGREWSPEPVFDLLCKLIKEKQLPASWFCIQGPHELAHLLYAAVETIGKSQGCTTAFGLITEVTSALCTARAQENSWRDAGTDSWLLKRIAAALVAVTSPGTCEGDKVAETRASFALDCCINHIQTRKGLDSEEALLFLSVARCLVGDGSMSYAEQRAHEILLDYGTAALELHGASALPFHHYHKVMDLVCLVAGDCRSKEKPAHEILVAMLEKIERLPWPRLVLRGLRKDGPFVLAQTTHDLRDLAFAESQQAVKTGSSPSERSGTMFSDWYWDETIGEFVERSPQKEEGGSSNAPQPQAQSPTRHCSRQEPQLSQVSPTVNEEAADVAGGSDDGVDLRSESGIAEEKENTETMNKRSRKTSNKSETNEDFGEEGVAHAGQGRRIKGRQWKLATDQGSRLAKLGFAFDDASPAPIGGARQLFIVRGPGPGRRNVGEDHDWLEW